MEEAPKLDKSTWGPGPWQEEPDRVVGEHLGFPTIARRTPAGVWCGYVAVPPGHPWHGKEYLDIDAQVHGGLTYAGPCHGDVCHVPKPGEPDDVWWCGFDCAHAYDLAPGLEAQMRGVGMSGMGGIYRDLEFVQAQIRSLAEQANGGEHG